MRCLKSLPKAHLHIHFTGSMRTDTLTELAARDGVEVPPILRNDKVHGWHVFQSRYEVARSTIRTGADATRIMTEAVEDAAAEGCQWLELQVDPTGYAHTVGGTDLFMELLLETADSASQRTGTDVGLIVAASWAAPPAVAYELAKLASRYREHGVVGFGIANDERLSRPADFADAFNLARNAGLLIVPHGGAYEGPWHVRDCVEILGASRIGHGIRAIEDSAVMDMLRSLGVALEICPTSYPALGLTKDLESVPVRAIMEAGVSVVIGSDDPILFGGRLVDQYETLRQVLSLTDAELAVLARDSFAASAAPEAVCIAANSRILDWLYGE